MDYKELEELEGLTEEQIRQRLEAQKNEMREKQKTFTSAVFETSPENMAMLRELFDTRHEVFCPIAETTFEQFCGYMIVAGTNFIQKEFIRFAMRQMLQGV